MCHHRFIFGILHLRVADVSAFHGIHTRPRILADRTRSLQQATFRVSGLQVPESAYETPLPAFGSGSYHHVRLKRPAETVCNLQAAQEVTES